MQLYILLRRKWAQQQASRRHNSPHILRAMSSNLLGSIFLRCACLACAYVQDAFLAYLRLVVLNMPMAMNGDTHAPRRVHATRLFQLCTTSCACSLYTSRCMQSVLAVVM